MRKEFANEEMLNLYDRRIAGAYGMRNEGTGR